MFNLTSVCSVKAWNDFLFFLIYSCVQTKTITSDSLWHRKWHNRLCTALKILLLEIGNGEMEQAARRNKQIPPRRADHTKQLLVCQAENSSVYLTLNSCKGRGDRKTAPYLSRGCSSRHQHFIAGPQTCPGLSQPQGGPSWWSPGLIVWTQPLVGHCRRAPPCPSAYFRSCCLFSCRAADLTTASNGFLGTEWVF